MKREEFKGDFNLKRGELPPHKKLDHPHDENLPRKDETRQSSGFMRDARRAGTGLHHYSHRNSEDRRPYETSRRVENYSYSRTRNYSPSHRSHSSQVSQRQNGPRWVDSGRRLPAPEASHSRVPENSITREKEHTFPSNSLLHSSAQRTERNSSPQARHQRTSQNPNLPINISLEAINDAREELREVMIQYVNVADPSESAARRERMRYAEEHGETEEVIRNMVIAATATATPETRTGNEDQPSAERVPALARLVPAHPVTIPTDDSERVPAKKRLGRPPLNKNKKQTNPLGVTAGQTSKKRKLLRSGYHLKDAVLPLLQQEELLQIERLQ
ncbi:hypothetical protein YC2023_093437 [Brassica napus]